MLNFPKLPGSITFQSWVNYIPPIPALMKYGLAGCPICSTVSSRIPPFELQEKY